MRLHGFKKHPNGIAWFQKVRASNKFSREQKRRVKKFFDCKRIWKIQEKNQISIYRTTMNILTCKGRSSQSFYIINIMNFSKYAQEIYFYLLVVSLYSIQNKLKIFIHLLISSRLPRSNKWFQVEIFWRKYNEKLHFRI